MAGELDTLWREQLEPWLDGLKAERAAAFRFLAIMAPAGVMAGILAAFGLGSAGAPEQVVIIAGIGLPILFIGIGATRLMELAEKTKKRVLAELADLRGLEYSAKPYLPSRFSRFESHGLLPDHHRRNFEDHFQGGFHGADFELYEAKLERRYRTKNGTRYRTVFRGVLIRIGFPRKVEGVTVVTRDKGLFNAFEAMSRSWGSGKLKRIGLVDPKFEKIFEVYGTDQVLARYMLTPSFMERLLALESAFKGKNVRAVFDEDSGAGELLIAAETGDQFEVSSLFKPIPGRREVFAVLEEIRLVTEIIDLLVQPSEFGEHAAPDEGEQA